MYEITWKCIHALMLPFIWYDKFPTAIRKFTSVVLYRDDKHQILISDMCIESTPCLRQSVIQISRLQLVVSATNSVCGQSQTVIQISCLRPAASAAGHVCDRQSLRLATSATVCYTDIPLIRLVETPQTQTLTTQQTQQQPTTVTLSWKKLHKRPWPRGSLTQTRWQSDLYTGHGRLTVLAHYHLLIRCRRAQIKSQSVGTAALSYHLYYQLSGSCWLTRNTSTRLLIIVSTPHWQW